MLYITRASRVPLYWSRSCVCYTFIWIDQIKAVKSRNIFIFCLHFYTDTSYCFNDVHNEHRVQSYKVLLEVANNAAKNMHVPAFTQFEAALVCLSMAFIGLAKRQHIKSRSAD